MRIEPFGYFKADPFGWMDCAETEAGAVPLYDRTAIDNLEDRVRELEALNETRLGEIRTTLQLLASARREAAEAQALVAEADEDIASWGAYAGEYFQQKHDLLGCLAKYREAKASALAAAIELAVAPYKQRAQEAEGMAQSMQEARQILTTAGLIPAGTAPVFTAEAVLAAVSKLRADTERLDWLETMTVNVRTPLLHGPSDLFWEGPRDDDGDSLPSKLRDRIDHVLKGDA